MKTVEHVAEQANGPSLWPWEPSLEILDYPDAIYYLGVLTARPHIASTLLASLSSPQCSNMIYIDRFQLSYEANPLLRIRGLGAISWILMKSGTAIVGVRSP